VPGIAAVDTRHTEPLEQRRARQGQLFVAGVAGVAGEESAALEFAPGMPQCRVFFLSRKKKWEVSQCVRGW
jgi:hypothetical protein